MIYVALDSFETHLERVIGRATLGGHSASESTLRRIYQSSLANLRSALDPDQSGIEKIQVFDNSVFNGTPRLVLESIDGRLTRLAANFPAWLQTALNWTDSDLAAARADIPAAH